MNFQKLSEYLHSLEREHQVPASCCRITVDHQTVFSQSDGWMDEKKSRPVQEQSLFRLFSATKIVTVIATLQLIERGSLRFSDSVEKYLPEYGALRVADHYESGRIPVVWPTSASPCHLAHHSPRIIDLLTMTAGMSYNTFAEEIQKLRKENTGGTREGVRAIAKMPLLFDPSTRWAYGLEHDVLAAIIEIVSGLSFGTYLNRNIFEPMEIEPLYFRLKQEQKERLVKLYRFPRGQKTLMDDDGALSGSFAFTDQYESGGAGLTGSTESFSAILEALANGGIARNGQRILHSETVQLLSLPYTTGEQQADFAKAGKKGYSYGLGVRVLTDASASRSPLGEFGWDGAAGAYWLVDLKNRLSVFYAEHIMGHIDSYFVIHPAIRDLAYEGLES